MASCDGGMVCAMRRTRAERVALRLQEYGESHRHPVNRACHTIGIPLIVSSVVLFAVVPFKPRFSPVAGALFATGWLFQFVGHGVEGKPPTVLRDFRFLFVGLRWWIAEIRQVIRAASFTRSRPRT